MKGWVIWVLIIICIIISGFLTGLFSSVGSTTLMACSCPPNASESECNHLTLNKGIFVTGIFNIQKDCSGTEIIKCSEGNQIGREERYDNCKFKLSFFKLRF